MHTRPQRPWREETHVNEFTKRFLQRGAYVGCRNYLRILSAAKQPAGVIAGEKQ